MHRTKKWFVCILSVCLFCMLLSQMLMLNDNIKNKLSTVYRMESEYVFSEQPIPKGSIEIMISSPKSDIYLLQNGEPVAVLDQKKTIIDVYDNTVFEIDGRNSNKSFLVKIRNVSENICGYYEKEITVNKNIVILGRFFIK